MCVDRGNFYSETCLILLGIVYIYSDRNHLSFVSEGSNLEDLFKISDQTFQIQCWMRNDLVKSWALRRGDWRNLINHK
jgi:hypothetical protein